MNADDDPDWEEVAKKAEFNERLADCHQRIVSSRPLDLKNLATEIRLLVKLCNGETIEFEITDPETGRVLVKDEECFRQPAEAILLGCEDNEAITPGTNFPSRRILLRGKLKQICWPIFEVNGKRFECDGISGIKVALPSGVTYDLWDD